MLRALHVALVFLTTLPLPPIKAWQEDDARRSVQAYPLVGLILGVILWGAAWVLGPGLGPLPDTLRGALLLGLWLLLTGALHFDGFCDMADAAFSSKSPEARQKIAKDPHLGAFALAAGGVLLLTKAAALGSVTPALLLLIPLLSRTVVVLPLTLGRTHGSSRLGRSTQPSLSQARLPLLLGLALGVGSGVLTQTLTAFLWLACAALVTTALVAWWLDARLGGLGGDAYGAIIETNEAVMLIVAVLLHPALLQPALPQ